METKAAITARLPLERLVMPRKIQGSPRANPATSKNVDVDSASSPRAPSASQLPLNARGAGEKLSDPHSSRSRFVVASADPELVAKGRVALGAVPMRALSVREGETVVDPSKLRPNELRHLFDAAKDESRAPLLAHFEQARNLALTCLDVAGTTPRSLNRMRFGAFKGLVNGFEFRGTPRRHIRIDFDEKLGPHIQVEIGRGRTRDKFTFRWLGAESDFAKQLQLMQHLDSP